MADAGRAGAAAARSPGAAAGAPAGDAGIGLASARRNWTAAAETRAVRGAPAAVSARASGRPVGAGRFPGRGQRSCQRRSLNGRCERRLDRGGGEGSEHRHRAAGPRSASGKDGDRRAGGRRTPLGRAVRGGGGGFASGGILPFDRQRPGPGGGRKLSAGRQRRCRCRPGRRNAGRDPGRRAHPLRLGGTSFCAAQIGDGRAGGRGRGLSRLRGRQARRDARPWRGSDLRAGTSGGGARRRGRAIGRRRFRRRLPCESRLGLRRRRRQGALRPAGLGPVRQARQGLRRRLRRLRGAFRPRPDAVGIVADDRRPWCSGVDLRRGIRAGRRRVWRGGNPRRSRGVALRRRDGCSRPDRSGGNRCGGNRGGGKRARATGVAATGAAASDFPAPSGATGGGGIAGTAAVAAARGHEDGAPALHPGSASARGLSRAQRRGPRSGPVSGTGGTAPGSRSSSRRNGTSPAQVAGLGRLRSAASAGTGPLRPWAGTASRLRDSPSSPGFRIEHLPILYRLRGRIAERLPAGDGSWTMPRSPPPCRSPCPSAAATRGRALATGDGPGDNRAAGAPGTAMPSCTTWPTSSRRPSWREMLKTAGLDKPPDAFGGGEGEDQFALVPGPGTGAGDGQGRRHRPGQTIFEAMKERQMDSAALVDEL